MNNIEHHKKILDELHDTYKKKNSDYGNSVHDTYKKYGLISYLTRMDDKMNRLGTLQKVERRVSDETVEDTLMDLANYALMAAIELRIEREQDE